MMMMMMVVSAQRKYSSLTSKSLDHLLLMTVLKPFKNLRLR